MNYLLELFQKAISSHSTNEIGAVTKEILSQYPNQEFYGACNQIILEGNDQIPLNIKQSAIIYFTNGIKEYWKDNFNANLKIYILNLIPEILAHSPFKLHRLCEKLSDIIVNFSLLVDNHPFFLEILPQLFQQDVDFIRAGLIISKSICKYIKNPTDEFIQRFTGFQSLIFPFIATLCQGCDDLLLLNFAYHCLSRLLIKSTEITEQMIQNYGSIYYAKFLSTASNIPDPVNNVYAKFLIEGIKFLSQNQVSKKLNNEQAENVFRFFQTIFQIPIDKSLIAVKAKVIKLLDSLIIKDERYAIFEANMQLIMEMIFLQLMITDQDINDMENDPEAFIQENPQASPDWNDVKASCLRFISNYIIQNNKAVATPLISFIYQIASTYILQSGTRQQIFTSFRMLTAAVSSKCVDFITQFLPYLCQAFDHPDFVIRAGSFLLLSNVSKCNIPRQVIDSCLNHLNDPAPIVRYYTALALSQSLYLSKNQPEYQEFKALYSPHINTIYTSLIEISTQFNDSYISDALSSFVLFFDDQILPFVVPLFDKIVETFIISSISDSDLSGIGGTSSHALHILIKIIGHSKNMDAESIMPLYSHFYLRLFEAMQATADYQNVSLLFPLLASLINLSPVFILSFWDLLDPLLAIVTKYFDLDDAMPIIEQLIFKDTELHTREPIVVALCKILLSSDALITQPTFCASLIMRFGPNLPCMNEIVLGIKNTAASLDGKSNLEGESISNIVSTIFLTFENYSFLFEGGDMTLLRIWVVQHSFPFYLPAFLKVFNNFADDPNLQAQMLRAAFQNAFSSGDKEEDLYLDDDDMYIDDENMGDLDDNEDDELIEEFQAKPGEINMEASENPQWFDEKLLVQQLFQLASQLHESQSPVVQILGQDEFIHNMNMLSAYPNHKKAI